MIYCEMFRYVIQNNSWYSFSTEIDLYVSLINFLSLQAGIDFGHGDKQLRLPGSLTPSIVDLVTDPRQIEQGTYGLRVDNLRLEDIPTNRNTWSISTISGK